MGVEFQFRCVHKEASMPSRKRTTDAGYDLSSVASTQILPGEFASIPVGLQISAPSGYYYAIEGRSGMLMKGLVVSRGTIDGTYTGDLYVILHNHSRDPHTVNIGDRIAQLVPHKIIHIEFNKVDEFSPEYCIRGQAGFGSSGR